MRGRGRLHHRYYRHVRFLWTQNLHPHLKLLVVCCCSAAMSTLPWDQDPTHPGAGWTVKTTIEKSAIPAAGSGRYVQEDVPKGAVIRETVLVNAGSTGCELRPGTTVLCRNLEELLSTFNIDEAADYGTSTTTGGKKNSRKIEQVVNFGASTQDMQTVGAKFEQTLFFWVPSVYINHEAGRANVIMLLESPGQSKAFIVALRDIKAGEELYLDYSKFSLPSWFKEFCRSRSLKDVKSFACELMN